VGIYGKKNNFRLRGNDNDELGMTVSVIVKKLSFIKVVCCNNCKTKDENERTVYS